MQKHTHAKTQTHTSAKTYTHRQWAAFIVWCDVWFAFCTKWKAHSYPTSFDLRRPHTCSAAHIKEVGIIMTSTSSRSSVHLATRGLPYEHCVSIFQDLCFPMEHTVSLSCSLWRDVAAYSYDTATQIYSNLGVNPILFWCTKDLQN